MAKKRPQDANLVRGPKAHKLTAEEASRGGKKSAETRKQKADLRKAAQAVLTGTYTSKSGEKFTGEEMLIKGLVANLADPKGRNWARSIEFLISLTDADKSDSERKRDEAELELLKAKIKLMSGGDDGAMSKLDEILGELEKTANANAKSETE